MSVKSYAEIAPVAEAFCAPRASISIGAFLFDLALYTGAVIVAIVADSVFIKIGAAVVAGTAISMLFILGHDAAHKSLVPWRSLNAILGRIVFLPCLHNQTLWVIQHNRLHHQVTNVKGFNSYSPLSLEEFRALPLWKRARERLYRTILGFGLYYLIERWWRDKFFPRAKVSVGRKPAAWLDFALLCAWTLVFGIGVATIGVATGGGAINGIVWGFVIPFLIWNQLMGLTAFLQHTHPAVPWYKDKADARSSRSQAEVTIVVQFPQWYDLLSHNIMQHQAHHISPRIPWFRLKKAQRSLTPLIGERAVVERMTIPYVLRLTRACQLYDYDNHRWLRFSGRPSTIDGEITQGQLDVALQHK
jgi:omega-6 fatty acid desaturase (delta-12 desaturase)